MTENTLLQLGNPLLRKTAKPVTEFKSAEFLDCLINMQNIMETGKGVGIAAPQIGISQQIVIIASRPTNRYPHAPEMPATIMCNPQLEILDPTLIKDWEGCLSVPGIRALVPRHQAIRIRFQDRDGDPQHTDLTGFPARVFQHEFDHLQGMVYLDRIETTTDIIAESEYLKLIAS